MNQPPPGCSPRPPDRPGPRANDRRGTTLIEVLAGLVILGTLLASVALARGRFLRQWADADKRLAAAKAADSMLAGWMANPRTPVPLRGEGPLQGVLGYTWRTSSRRNPAAERLLDVIVRLEVYEPGGARPPILTVEFLRHDFPKLQQPAPGGQKGVLR